jgi:hypothetical protein
LRIRGLAEALEDMQRDGGGYGHRLCPRAWRLSVRPSKSQAGESLTLASATQGEPRIVKGPVSQLRGCAPPLLSGGPPVEPQSALYRPPFPPARPH